MSDFEITRGPYSLVYADPPWQYRDKGRSGKRGVFYKYKTMSVHEICCLPVADICANDCLLAMWWVPPMPYEALAVVEAWGFTLKTMKGFTWRKLTVGGLEHFGMGNWTRANTEDCLLACRGKPARVRKNVRQLVSSVRREHSRKPDEVRDNLVQLVGDVPRIELFARHKHPGWDCWGIEV